MFKSLIQFFKSKTFFKNLAIYLVSFFLLCWIVVTWLSSYTSHGETIPVPDFKGVKITELDKFVSDKNVRYLVIDSIYDVKSPAGVVVKQEPEANAKVKDNRMIYLYVTSVLPPSIVMPKLIDRSLRQAAAMITTYGLKLGKTKFVPDQCANCVLDQLIKGKKVTPGDVVTKGTIIDLVVGKGLSDEEVGVPCLFGLTRKEALEKLAEYSLSVGATTFDSNKDSLSSKVYRQSPTCGHQTTINLGGTVDLFLTTDKDKIPTIVDTTETKKKDDEEPD